MTNVCPLSINKQAYLKQYENILVQIAEKMYSAPLSESISGSFIVQMIPHHTEVQIRCETSAFEENLYIFNNKC